MIYMLAAMPAGHDMAHGMDMPEAGSPGIALPMLAWALVAYFLVYAVRLGARLIEPVNTAGGGAPRVVTSPQLLGSGLVGLSVGMSYLLVTML